MNLLILYPLHYWETKMSSGRRDVIWQLTRSTPAVLSGQGWPAWKDSLPLRQNIANLMPEAEAILWYKPDGNPKENVPAIIDPCDRDIPAVAIYNEAYWENQRASRECQAVGTDLVIHHHLNDADRFGDTPAVHIPHCANQMVFYHAAKPWSERTTPLLVTGVLNRDIYPLRTQVAELIKAGRLPGKVLPHPGYRLASVEACEEQQRAYAAELGNAKYVVCCSSKYRYGLAKYPEAAQAGARVIGDCPPEFYKTIGREMIKLSPQWSDDELVAVIEKHMQHEPWYVAYWGQRLAIVHHSIFGYCDRLLATIREFTGQWQPQRNKTMQPTGAA